MSSVIVDRPVVTTPSSEWGGDPVEGRLSPRYTPTSYFRPTARSSPYSRPHPPTSGELEVPGAYPRDPRDALDDLSASAQDYQLGVQDFLPAREDVQKAMSSVGSAAMGAIGAVGAAGASLVAAASGEEQVGNNESGDRLSNDQIIDATETEPALYSASIDNREALMVPADMPSAPFLIPMPQFSDGALGAAPVAASYTEETTIAGSDAADYVLLERNLQISEAAVIPTDALSAPNLVEEADDDLTTAEATSDYDDVIRSNPSLDVGNSADDDVSELKPLANNDSAESLGSETGAGIGLGMVSSGCVPEDDRFSTELPSAGLEEDLSRNMSETYDDSKDLDESAGQSSPPVSKLHLAAGAVGVVGTAASLIAKVAKRKSVPSPDTIPEESHSDVASFSSGLPADIPQSPAIFNDEFAAQPPSPAPVGRPEIDETAKKDAVDQSMWTPGSGPKDLEGETVPPISSSYQSDIADIEPSTHTPAVALPHAPAPMRNLSSLSSPAALAAEDVPTSRMSEEAGMNAEEPIVNDEDSSKEEKVGKINLLAGAVGAAGVAVGLVAKIAARKSPVKTGKDANQFGTSEDDVSLNSPIPSELPKSPGIFTEEFASAPPMIAGDHLTIPATPNASDSPLARLPEDTTPKEMNIDASDAIDHSSTNRSMLPIPVATYRSDAAKLPEPGVRANHDAQSDAFMSMDSPSGEFTARNEGNLTRSPACAVVGSQSEPLTDNQRFRSRSVGGMGVNGLYVPDAHPPFAQLSTLPEVGQTADPTSTVEAPLGVKAHGEDVGTYRDVNAMAPAQTSGYSANEYNTGDGFDSATSGHPGYASSGSSGRSYEEVVDGPNGPMTVRKKGKSKKASVLVEKVKEVLRF